MKLVYSHHLSGIASAFFLALGLLLFSSGVSAGVRIEIPSGYSQGREFRQQVQALLKVCEEADSSYLNRFSEYLGSAPVDIVITPVTDDPVTWYGFKDKVRSHARPDDEDPAEFGRLTPTASRVYIFPAALQPGHPEYQSGVVIHQLVHAVDMAYGRFHPSESVRERRAVFVENIWRDIHGHVLRETFQNRFPTMEYMKGRDTGHVGAYIEYIFNASEFPYTAHGAPEG